MKFVTVETEMSNGFRDNEIRLAITLAAWNTGLADSTINITRALKAVNRNV